MAASGTPKYTGVCQPAEAGTRGHTKIPGLQGLRACAVIAVFLHHVKICAPGGKIGVYVFFALSGYLITTLMIREMIRTGHVNLGNFYIRRILRLYPALIVVVAVVSAYSFKPGAVGDRRH